MEAMRYNSFKGLELSALGFGTMRLPLLEDGTIVTGGQELTMSQLEELFDTSVQVAGVRTLVIQADKGVPHGRVVEVMESAKQKGLTNLAIATQQSQD